MEKLSYLTSIGPVQTGTNLCISIIDILLLVSNTIVHDLYLSHEVAGHPCKRKPPLLPAIGIEFVNSPGGGDSARTAVAQIVADSSS